MNHTTKSILILTGVMLSVSLSAQTLTPVQRRQFNIDALRMLENYENCSQLYNMATRMEFDMLFNDASMHIFNDLNGLSAAPTLSVSDYSELLSSKGKSTQVIIKNVSKSDPYFDNEWKMDVTFDKEITYANNCEILFSSKEYFGADYHIGMTLVWDEDMRSCTICRLDGERGSEREMLPSDYFILTNTSKRDFQVKADGDTLSFNAFGQAFLSPDAKFVYPDQDVRMKVIKKRDTDCNIISLKYIPTRWRIKLHYDMSLGGFYYANGKADASSTGTEIGMDLGYVIPSKKKVKWHFMSGVALSKSILDMSLTKLDYMYTASPWADIDGDSYLRHYSISGMKQTFESTDIVVPAYLETDIRWTNNISSYLDAGIKMYLNLKKDLKIKTGHYSTYGEYTKYGLVMRPEDNWNGNKPINGFVSGASISDDIFNTEMHYKDFSIDVMGRAGLRWMVIGDLYLDAALSLQMSLLSPFNADRTIDISTSNPTEDEALMTYSVEKGETIRGLQGSYSWLRRQALNLNLGIMYRF